MSDFIRETSKNLDLSDNRPLKELLYEAMRKTIILGEVATGVRINEKEVSRQMNISRTPIRYALKQLENDDLVDHIQGKGVIIKGISVKDACEIYAIRIALDTLAEVTAMNNMTEADFDTMNQLLVETERANEQDNVDIVMEKIAEFNNMLYSEANMPRLKSIIYKLREYLIYFRDIAIRARTRRDKALLEHRIIYSSMRLKDKNALERITRQHLEDSQIFVIKEMEKRKNN
ncbi:GntR family transcriptional regulator [Loigolactobacillus coryniformis]|uniref:GntR family transcriptional regulator n=1 Tax=Loigolactobacillus coryniformis subsp. torquens DSM 20004 = KCTC 3535 TaxID=1423822 RepID=A0A2D1KL39_9LACO|nr:GntR family transcriptional regulator [Loigolactobacillus coryniformis]ATO42860.1 GntR family transcriptional regulator [Loigolactobacillus coryniformis subsp. torquens DSM 20004 = KCTC 3535]KRK84529.1 citrate catabolism transcriptional regulator [Loigolactobacillus coryniformis subsp. torquens DSM 20004 = KCTC 3535]